MERRHGLIELLNNYQTADANEEKCRQEILVFVKLHPECFDNDFPLGHVTGSAIVVDRKFE
ncbi:MAG: NUDIX hydrolase, partial [Candidatus Amesbacteria bacterium GW2011_GWB1_48_13]